jgi:hypothetical protein
MTNTLSEISYLKHFHNALIHVKSNRHQEVKLDDATAERKADEISSSIKQFLEYYDAAKNVTLTTKPLLLYYGFLSLARAAVIFRNKNIFLKDIKYHGLISIHDEEVPPEEETIEVRQGLFPLLSSPPLPAKTRFSLKELLAVYPERPETFTRYFKESIKCLRCHFIHGYSGGGYFLLKVDASDSRLRDIFPDLDKYFTIQKSQGEETFLQNKPEYRYPVEIPICSPNYLIKPIKGYRIDPISSSYAIMFLLSSLVRYKPVVWNRIINGGNTGIGYVLEDYIGSCSKKFPEYISNQLFYFRTI